MIASLAGMVTHVGLGKAVISVGGVGFSFRATPTTLAGLAAGREAEVFTSLVVREDSLTLFGFSDADEKDVFESMQSVSGIGPSIALAMLAVHTPNALRRAVEGEDVAALCRVPGVGKKSAQRIVLELKGKLGAPTGGPDTPAPARADVESQLTDALTGLGWQAATATKAAAAAVEAQPEADVATLLRAALQSLGGGRA
ncbi:MAG: Holliday junction branch migration protein RuvA [Buchananella hordeovulneris]|nr:Holliday junction branch migration protein RuvA [Buchananella hordeovulneris]